MTPLNGILISIILILANAFFVAIEFALARVNKTRIEHKVKEKNKTALLILDALNNIDKYISASQVGITISSLALGAIGEISLSEIFVNIFSNYIPNNFINITAHSIALPVTILIVTYFHVVIGEIIPKTVAFVNPEKTAFYLIWPLEILTVIFDPLVKILNLSASTILRLFKITDLRTTFVYTEDELKMLLNVSQEEGVLEESEKEMITNIFDFPDTIAREVMTPRTDMHCVEANKTLEEIIEAVIESKHSRIPVFEDTIDNILGVLTTRDLLEEIHLGNYKKVVKEITKPIVKVPESKPLDDLLAQLKRKSLQLAIVQDEFGGTAGLVTIEDIIEEIIGEIHDEFDETPQEQITHLENGDLLIDAKANIYELNEKLNLKFPTDHHDTIGGLTFGLIGKEPAIGDEVESNGFIIRVEAKDFEKQRINKVRLIQKQKDPTTTQNGKIKENNKKEELKSEN